LSSFGGALFVAIALGVTACQGSSDSAEQGGAGGAVSGGAGGAASGGAASGGAVGAAGGSPIEQSDFPSTYASTLCAAAQTCCSRAGDTFDLQACVKAASTDVMAITAQDPSRVTYDAVAAGNCVAGLASLLSSCVITTLGDVTPAACSQMLHGKLTLGASCNSSQECSDSSGPAICSASGTGGSVCVASVSPSRGKSGDPCRATCTEDIGGQTCQAMVGMPGTGTGGTGGGSAASADCFTNDNLYCSSSTGSCQALPLVGAKCPDGRCADHAYCAAQSTMCSASTGQNACATDAECQASSYCNIAAVAMPGSCSPKLADGAACTSAEQCSSGGCNANGCGPLLAASAKSCAGKFL
jgi:hypothetical protein